MSERFEVQRTIPFDAATIFGVISSPAGHVAIDASGMLQGYEGDPCGECGNFTLVRNGTCMKCDTCGSTTGCS